MSIRGILESTGFFYDFEIDTAMELVEEKLTRGEESGYSFIIAEKESKTIAFACFGKTPCTVSSYDLYWMAVHNDQKGGGIGKELMKLVEEKIAESGGKNIWIETSSRALYEPTRMFYLKTGSEFIAELPNFYGENDNKIIYLKKV